MKESILFQLDMCWQLYLYHMDNLEEAEALWVFNSAGLQVYKQEDGWRIDWPETESYEIGPAQHCVDFVAYYILVEHCIRLQFWKWHLKKRRHSLAGKC